MIIRFKDEDINDRKYIPEGETEVIISKLSDEKQSKAGNPMLTIEFSDSLGRTAIEYYSLSDNAKFKIANLALACGYTAEQLKADGLDVPKLLGKKLLMVKKQTGTEMYNDKERKVYSVEFFKSKESPSQTEDDIMF